MGLNLSIIKGTRPLQQISDILRVSRNSTPEKPRSTSDFCGVVLDVCSGTSVYSGVAMIVDSRAPNVDMYGGEDVIAEEYGTFSVGGGVAGSTNGRMISARAGRIVGGIPSGLDRIAQPHK